MSGSDGAARRRRAPRAVAGRALAAAPGIVAAAGCRGVQSALDPRGPQAAALYELTLVMFVGAAVIFAIVMALLVAALLRRRGEHDDPDHHRRRVVAVAVGAGLTVATLLGLLVHSVLVSRAITEPPRDPVRIEVAAQQWWWDFRYAHDEPSRQVRIANELVIPVGRPVELTLLTRDVIHSFWVPNLHGKMDAIPGRRNTLVLQADAPGVWRGQCAEFCGLQHAKMAFVVVAVPPDGFERWLEEQRAPARTPEDPVARRGQEVFLASACASCHAIRGTGALAAAGPDLTHLASRRTLAAGTLPNSRGNLGGWILDPQHVKPGAFMPPTALDAADLHALLTYLESLR